MLGVLICAGALAAVWAPLGSAALPAPDQLVPNTVARIAEAATHDDGTIARAELRHASAIVAAGENRRVPAPGERDYEKVTDAALAGLLEAIWIRGQAEEMGIVVTRDEIKRLRDRIVRENFQSAAEFREFLRESRMTRRDVYERVELQVLSIRLQRRIVAGAASDKEKQAAFSEFLDEFNARWRARTVCAPEHASERCSNGPPPAAGA